jgi:hypothetical protein
VAEYFTTLIFAATQFAADPCREKARILRHFLRCLGFLAKYSACRAAPEIVELTAPQPFKKTVNKPTTPINSPQSSNTWRINQRSLSSFLNPEP